MTEPYYRVQVSMRGAGGKYHFASKDEPVVNTYDYADAAATKIKAVFAQWFMPDDDKYWQCTLPGFIDWSEVAVISWRPHSPSPSTKVYDYDKSEPLAVLDDNVEFDSQVREITNPKGKGFDPYALD